MLVGDDPGSHAYVAASTRTARRSGSPRSGSTCPPRRPRQQLDAEIDRLNADPSVTGYIVQLPLPKHLDANRVLTLMDPARMPTGCIPTNLGRLVLGEPAPLPCTPRGIVELLRRYGVEINGAEVVVVGRGVTVGRPLGLLLTRKSENATVTLCHTGTRDLAAHLRTGRHHRRRGRRSASGHRRPGPPGAAVLDVGITRTEAGLVGDVQPDVMEVAGFVAPMPGGVGPMTRAMLIANVVEAAERHAAGH